MYSPVHVDRSANRRLRGAAAAGLRQEVPLEDAAVDGDAPGKAAPAVPAGGPVDRGLGAYRAYRGRAREEEEAEDGSGGGAATRHVCGG